MDPLSHAATSIVGDASLLAAGGAFLAIALLAVAAAGLVIAGEAAHSQLRLATVSLDAMSDMRDGDICSARPVCANPQQHLSSIQRVC
ncbi:hypothetical protein SAMN05444747_107325 [Variovorax sp. OV329]|nr:hypothetical protein SAMN05444747_107325 [Variovorax sp. OV329]